MYKTRYQADKERKTNPFHSMDEHIVKVYGGYILMTNEQYYDWKLQK